MININRPRWVITRNADAEILCSINHFSRFEPIDNIPPAATIKTYRSDAKANADFRASNLARIYKDYAVTAVRERMEED